MTTSQIIKENQTGSFDVEIVRKDFPLLKRMVHGKPLVYLDNAATSQKPLSVIEAIERYYSEENANIHRGVHWLSDRATEAYENARARIARYINAAKPQEVIFTRGTTESINLVAFSWGWKNLRDGDEVLISAMEHHSNIVPWQMICAKTGAKLRVIPVSDNGDILLDEYRNLLNPKTRIVAVTHVSNVLGTVNPIAEMVQWAHDNGSLFLLDGAQSIPHMDVNVRDLDCDFFAFSGHKLFGPTGIGVLYGKFALLEEMDPYQGGGDMIRSVTFEKTIYNSVPHKFEAGTPHIAGGIGLGEAIVYLEKLNRHAAEIHETNLLHYGESLLRHIPGVRIIGNAKEKAGAISFLMDGVHPHDIGTILDQEGIAIRTGHHCCQPLMERFGIPATARASLAFYNSREDLDALAEALGKVRDIFHY
jgi:cysteine desulfurase/selenocysteine lyase